MAQVTKLTYEKVSEFVRDKGCKLISEQYINMKQKLEIQCNCGNLYITNLDTFKNKNKTQCNDCSKAMVRKANTTDSKEIKKYIESKGCYLLSEYKNAKDKLKIKCNCGNLFERNFNKFKSGQTNCLECTGRINWDFDKVKNLIEVESDSGNKLKSKEYINRKQKLDIECVCGNAYCTDFHTFLYENKRCCEDCSKVKFREKRRTGIDNLKKIVSNDSESELLSEDYVNYSETLIFKCKCNNTFETSMISFSHGKRSCDRCSPSSKLESISEKYFIENEIKYISQYTFDDLLSPKKRKLKFDFALMDELDEIKFLLELDGEQHFKPSNLFGGQVNFEKQLVHDNLKNEYCKNKSIKLVRVSYKELKNLENVLSKIISEHDNPVPS